LAGTAGGALQSGQYLPMGNVSGNQLLLTILHAYGFTGTSFGHPDHSGDLLSGILV
jgi:hypothetical protein